MTPHLLLAGYFGCGNLGDDSILLGFMEGLKDIDVDLTLLSGSPEATFRAYGVRSAPRRDLRRVQEAIESCDALVFPGGSVFQDVTSLRSVGYYSTLVRRAKKAGKKVLLLGQGVGPLTSFLGKRMAASAYNAADVLVVRDPGSMNTLRALGVSRPVKVGADLAFLLPPARDSAGDFGVAGMKAVGIAPRPFGKHTKNVMAAFGDLIRRLYQNSYMPVLIPMDRDEDGPLILEIEKSQGGKIPDLRKIDSPRSLQDRISRMHGMIAMRLHAGILAANVGIPPLMVSYDPKVNELSKRLGLDSPPDLEGLNGQRLFEKFMAFEREHERNAASVARQREKAAQEAMLNVEALKECLIQ